MCFIYLKFNIYLSVIIRDKVVKRVIDVLFLYVDRYGCIFWKYFILLKRVIVFNLYNILFMVLDNIFIILVYFEKIRFCLILRNLVKIRWGRDGGILEDMVYWC